MSKIPQHAKQVFKGEVFEVWQWDQELYDGSSVVFEKLRRPNTLQSIAIIDGKIAVAFDEQPDRPGKYTLPGGRQDEGETPEEGARRELLEEAGFEAASMELLLQEDPANKLDWTIYIYVARDCKKVAEPTLDPGEKVDIRLVDFDEFIEIVLADDFMETMLQLYILKMHGDYTKFRKRLGV